MGPLLGLGVSAGIGAIKSLFGGGAAKKAAKAQAANESRMLGFQRDTSQKSLDRRRKILQGLRKFYATNGYLGANASKFTDLFGDLGQDVGADAYQLPQAPILEAQGGGGGFWNRLGSGLFEGGMDYLGQQATMPDLYPQRGGVQSPGQPIGPSTIAGSGGIRRVGGMTPYDDEDYRA
jgi:hypothetical protein